MYDSVKHFNSSYDSVTAEFAFQGKSVNELTSWQHEFRPRLKNAIGLDNLENDVALFSGQSGDLADAIGGVLEGKSFEEIASLASLGDLLEIPKRDSSNNNLAAAAAQPQRAETP